MAGRINDDDVVAVRDRAKIDEIVGSYVALRNAGGGSLKGLCPFHDEKTPSFQVTPSRGFFYCFGCGEGGDVITFMQKIDNLSFAEAIERLADKVGIQLRYTEDSGPRPEPGLRMRLMEAHQAAATYYSEQLSTPEALAGRQFLSERGFDRESAERFGVGFSPRTGKALAQHLRGRGFRDKELVAGGLVRENGFDFFRGRLLWPIRDSGKQVMGFGARRIFEDDFLPAKYINTPETPLYKKSQVLYGLDLARQPIGKKSQAVIVEGYTDVMAAHLSGVDTAVASCGTAFGDDHARLLRRLMGNHDAFRGEVIFTFDGDAAGQKAALKVFDGDQNFIAQTYVAVEPTGLDPCDLRLEHGEAAVRELVARRVPLYRFVMTNVLSQYDLDRADGRLQALRAAAPLVASIRDTGLVGGYVRELAGLLGMEMEEVRGEVMRAASRSNADRDRAARGAQGAGQGSGQARQGGTRQGGQGGQARNSNDRSRTNGSDPRGGGEQRGGEQRDGDQRSEDQLPEDRAQAQSEPDQPRLPDPHDRMLATERETAKLLVQAPGLFRANWDGLSASDFTHPAYAAVFASAERAAATENVGDWVHRVSAATEHDQIRSLVAALAVESLPIQGDVDSRFVVANSAGLQLLTVMRQIADLKSKLQRTNPVEAATRYNQMFSELVVLEARRKELQNRSLGADE